MNRKGLLYATVALLMSGSVTAIEWQFNPYLGADAQWRRTNFKGGFGDNVFAHTFPQANAYLGFKFHKYAGLEGGYEVGRSRTRITSLSTGDISLGAAIPPAISPVVFRSRAKFRGPHIDLVGYFEPVPGCNTQLIGSVGVAFLKGTFDRRTIAIRNSVTGATITTNTLRTLSQNKTVLRLGGGLQYMLCDNWGVRGMVGWENTARMVVFAKDGMPGVVTPEVKPRNSTNYSIGLLWSY